MNYFVGQILVAKRTFKNYNTTQYLTKGEKYSISVIHNSASPYDIGNGWRNYILVDDIAGYNFYIDDVSVNDDCYIWNNFYTSSEVRIMKLDNIKKINETEIKTYI